MNTDGERLRATWPSRRIAFGPKRLMWASDSPYQLQGVNTYRASIGLVRDRLDFLSKEDREWLLAKSAEAVYFHT